MRNQLLSERAQRLFANHKDLHDLLVHATEVCNASGFKIDTTRFLDYAMMCLAYERSALESPMVGEVERTIRGMWIDQQIRIHDQLRHGIEASA